MVHRLYQGWRTRDQIIQLFNGNSHLADAVVQKKKSEGQFREHPDLPDDPQMTLYYAPRLHCSLWIYICIKHCIFNTHAFHVSPYKLQVMVELSHTNQDIYEDKTEIRAEGALDPDSEAAWCCCHLNGFSSMWGELFCSVNCHPCKVEQTDRTCTCLGLLFLHAMFMASFFPIRIHELYIYYAFLLGGFCGTSVGWCDGSHGSWCCTTTSPIFGLSYKGRRCGGKRWKKRRKRRNRR